MKDACLLYPSAKDGNVSKFYKELERLTKKNRKLTNFLYALSLQPEIQSMFTHSDLNSQGEPKLSVFVDKLKVNDILTSSEKLEDKKYTLGAVDKKGDIIYYDNIFDITQRVIDFNQENEDIKATIKNSDRGYYIVVDTINSENFNFGNSLKIRLNVFNNVLQYLENKGLSTSLSENSLKQFNPLSIYYAISSLKSLKSNTENISIGTANLLLDLFANTQFATRLKSQLGDNAAKVIAQVSGTHVKDEEAVSTYIEEMVTRFLANVRVTLKKTLSEEFDSVVNESATNVSTTATYFNTSGLSIKDTLRELYRTYHIDQESLNLIQTRVTKISEAANKLLQIKLAKLRELQAKGTKVSDRALLKVQKEIEEERYLESITTLLQGIKSEISNSKVKMKRFSNTVSDYSNNLGQIRTLSNIVLKQLDLVNAFSPILSQLASISTLENDSPQEDLALLDDIKQVAQSLTEELRELSETARIKQYDAVYAFLKIYWGEDKTLPDGTIISLGGEEGIMNLAQNDINLFDRFLYAATSTNDTMFNLIAEAVKQALEKRDKVVKTQLRTIRTLTDNLFKSGSDMQFVFELDENGYPKKLISDYDYSRYEKEFEQYKKEIRANKDINKSQYKELENQWEQEHSKSVEYEYVNQEGESRKLKLTVPIYDAPIKVKDRLTEAQYKYYKTLMDMRADVISKISALNNNTLFDVIEISSDFAGALKQAGGNPTELYKIIKNKTVDLLGKREDDTQYGSILDSNNLKMVHTNVNGEILDTLPLFFTRQNKIKDRSRVSMDFSRNMIAFLSMSQQYIQLNNILDCVTLAKDWMLTQRKVQTEVGGKSAISILNLGKKTYTTTAAKLGIGTSLSSLTEDFYEKVIYGKTRKEYGTIFGVPIDKLTDTLVGYTSISGLALNVLGAEANVLVGKLQMLIESGLGLGGEFFNLKDMTFADAKYFQLLPEFLNECLSTNKSSLLGLMLEEFDALDDFNEKIKETGFYKNPISKIIGNTNLFFLYGMGEHLLHAQGMLAVLHNEKNKVLDKTGKEVTLFEAFTVETDENGVHKLAIKEGYTKKDGSAITEEDIEKIKKRIGYVNRSMHGAFNTFDKGMIHRYAFGRMIMNFRQWMPAHYSRRFRGRYYDSDLGDWREGYYVTAFKFLKNCAMDLKEHKFQIATRFRELQQPGHEMELYNLKRTIAETALLALLSASVALLGDEKDHKGNWARRKLIYLVKRLDMEVRASTPLAGAGFVTNIVTVLNSPMAVLNTVDKIGDLIRLTDLSETIETGKYKGENRYLHNLEKNSPSSPLRKMLEIGESGDLYNIFN